MNGRIPTSAVLAQFTQKRVENIKGLPQGVANSRQLAISFGVDIKTTLYIMGPYDGIAIGEAPNDEAIAKFILALSSMGTIRTQTMKGFTPAEFVKLISELPYGSSYPTHLFFSPLKWNRA